MKRAVIRLPSEVVERLDRLTAELRLAHPDESYSRASVARALIAGSLSLVTNSEDRAVIDVARRGARGAPRRGDALAA